MNSALSELLSAVQVVLANAAPLSEAKKRRATDPCGPIPWAGVSLQHLEALNSACRAALEAEEKEKGEG